MANTRQVVAGSAAGLAAVLALATPLVAQWEGRRLDPYTDIAGIRTVCYGETFNVKERRYSDQECRDLLNASLAKHTTGVLACLPANAPVQTKAAFASFGYNVGVSAACGSSAVRKLRAGDIRGACDGLLAWNKARHPVTRKLAVSRGLDNRRRAERLLCLEGLPGPRALDLYGNPV